jgi:hypothetical protein
LTRRPPVLLWERAARILELPAPVQDWRDYEFVIGDDEEISRSADERTGWETVRFEVADDGEPTEPA